MGLSEATADLEWKLRKSKGHHRESDGGPETSDTLNSSIPGTSSFMLKHTWATEEIESIRTDSFKPQAATCCFLDLFNCP